MNEEESEEKEACFICLRHRPSAPPPPPPPPGVGIHVGMALMTKTPPHCLHFFLSIEPSGDAVFHHGDEDQALPG